MSTFIQMPFNLTELKTKSNFLEIYTYFLIRSQIKNNSYTASIAETELADKLDVSDRTVKTYIKDLEPYFDKITKEKCAKQDHYYNVYHFTYLSKDYSIVNPALIEDDNLTAEQKGILLKIKLVCEKGTNFIKYGSKAELVKLIGINKNLINTKLQPLIDKGYLKYIGKSLHLSSNYFPLFLNDNIENYNYKVIYNYCIVNEVCPPLRDNKAISYMAAQYPNITDTKGNLDNSLLEDLTKRCPKLPKEVSLDYFVKALEHKEIKRDKINLTFIIQ